MKKNILLLTIALATTFGAAAQYTPVTFSAPVGICVSSPEGMLHVHNATADTPDIPVNPDDPGIPTGRNEPLFDYNYNTAIRLTNPNCGTSSTDGATLSQQNWKTELRNYEKGHICLRTRGGSVYLSETGRFGIGDTSMYHIFNVQGNSRLYGNTDVDGALTVTGSTTLANMQATGSVQAGSLSVGNGFTVNASGQVVVGSDITVGGTHISNSFGIFTASGAFSLNTSGNLTLQGGVTAGGNATFDGSLRVGNGFYCDAQGNAKVKELRVTLTDWPDYVFSDGYRLMPLGEVEGYIAENGHLPQMPSAAEVEAEGADLGEMNRLLMQKVEELTLYVIDLQKQLDELKSNK